MARTINLKSDLEAFTFFLKTAIENKLTNTVAMLSSANQEELKHNSSAVLSEIGNLISKSTDESIIPIVDSLTANGLVFDNETIVNLLRFSTNINIFKSIINNPLVNANGVFNASNSMPAYAIFSNNFEVAQYLLDNGYKLKINKVFYSESRLTSLFSKPQSLFLLLTHLDNADKNILIRTILDKSDRSIFHSYLGAYAFPELIKVINKTQLNSLLVAQGTIDSAYRKGNISALETLKSLNLPIKTTREDISLENLTDSETLFFSVLRNKFPIETVSGLRLSISNNYHEPITWIKKQLSSDERTLQLITCTSTDIFIKDHVTEDTLDLISTFTDTHTRHETLTAILYSAVKTFCAKINNTPLNQTFDLDSIYYFSNLGIHFDDNVVGKIIDIVFNNLTISYRDLNIHQVFKLFYILNDIYNGDLYTLMLSRSLFANKSIKQSLSILRRESSNQDIIAKSMSYLLVLSTANKQQRTEIVENMVIIDNKEGENTMSMDIELALNVWNTDPISFISEHSLSNKTQANMVKLTAI